MAASKHKMDLALRVALGSSMQIALFVTSFLVLLGWIIQQPMSLAFEPFDAVVFFLSVIVVAGLVPDGESNYLEGAILVGMCATFSAASCL
jgi:Ca2+:H+ antiporter